MPARASRKSEQDASGIEVDPRWRIILLAGPELYLQAENTRRIRAALEAAHGGVDVTLHDGASVRPAEVLDDCRTLGLMQPYRLVIVDAADQFVKEDSRPIIERYAAAPSESATLVLRASTWHKGKLDALIEKCGAVIPCAPPADIPTWLTRHAREIGVRISPRAAVLLVDRVGDDLGRLHGELEKLSLASMDSGGEISDALVAEMVGATREEDIWKSQARLLTANPEAALKHLHTLLDAGPREATVPVAYLCMDMARKIHACSRAIQQGISLYSVAGELKLWSAKEEVFALARKTGPRRAAKNFAQCVALDHRQKTGVGDPVRGLEILTLRFASLNR